MRKLAKVLAIVAVCGALGTATARAHVPHKCNSLYLDNVSKYAAEKIQHYADFYSLLSTIALGDVDFKDETLMEQLLEPVGRYFQADLKFNEALGLLSECIALH